MRLERDCWSSVCLAERTASKRKISSRSAESVKMCLRHGVEVIYVEEQFARDEGPYAALQKSMKRVMAADFSREKSRIVTHGKRRAAAQGFRSGAPPPYGMKRILVNPDGSFVQDLPPKAHKMMSCFKTMP